MSESPVNLNDELIGCSRFGELDDVIAIVSEGGDVNCADASGSSPLHYAAANGHLSVVLALVDRGAKFSANFNGNTPLHWAALNGHAGIAKAILEKDGFILDVLAKNVFGKSALTEALNGGHEDIARLILTHPSVGSCACEEPRSSAAETAGYSGEEVAAEDGGDGKVEESEGDIDDDAVDMLAQAEVLTDLQDTPAASE